MIAIKSLLYCMYATLLCNFVHVGALDMHKKTETCTVNVNASCPAEERVYPKDFRSPLGIPLVLSGTFGELRNNHFHAGIDIKTNGTENYRIYAVKEGYVSRIKISPRGYGNALYITHPNGYTSVYAHLNELKGAIGDYVEQQQYARESFALDLYPPSGSLPVTKGQVVALSGNTGGSAGPHLHFEIRDSGTEEALNPLLFGFQVADTRRPLLNQMAMYELDDNGYYSTPIIYDVISGQNGMKKLKTPIINVGSPKVGFGVKAYDKQNAANNLNGAYSVEMIDNGTVVYAYRVERIAFDESRYINSHTDYAHKKRGNGWIQKCFRDPGNRLNIYDQVINDGIIDLSDGVIHKIFFNVRDVAGNTTTLSFNVKYDPSKPAKSSNLKNGVQFFSHRNSNTFENSEVKVDFPSNAFYTDFNFQYGKRASTSEYVYSNYHKIHDDKTPVHQKFEIAIRGDRVPERLRNKVLIAYKNSKGSRSSAGGEWRGNYLVGSSKYFGEYYITVDTKAPTITPVNISNGKNMSKSSTITFKIADNLAGIKSYNGYIDGKWVLMQYDQKTGKLRYRFDRRVGAGNHTIKVVVTDYRDNVKTYTAKFRR